MAMKLVKIAASAALASAPLGHCGLVSLHRLSQQPIDLSKEEKELPFFGDSACPCIGFDNLEGGETTVHFDGGMQVAYPADLGSRCETWDNGRHPNSCQPGQEPGLGKGWCGKMWCFVDPCKCSIDVLPKVSVYVPDARYRGKPLFYSYTTCGDKDDFTKEVPQAGNHGCRCIGFDNMPGTTEVIAGGKTIAYPAEIGGSCDSWDMDTHPECKGDKMPDWCRSNWCYVDPCSCDLPDGKVPKISAYLPNQTFTGKNLYYSYETCNAKDTWTEKGNPDACVNQKSKVDCAEHMRCSWTGTHCLGTELVDHPLCKKAGDEMSKLLRKPNKGGSAQNAPRTALVILAAMATASAASSTSPGAGL